MTRLNSSRPNRPSRIPPRLVLELVEAVDDLSEGAFITSREQLDFLQHVLSRMERPLRHLCMEAGIPEAAERLRMSVVRARHGIGMHDAEKSDLNALRRLAELAPRKDDGKDIV